LSNVRAHWWNLKTHTHGITPLRDDGWLRAAAPRGAVIARTNGDLEVLRHNGGERSLGTPFRGDLVESAASSDDGLIVTSTFGEVAYMRWARRGHYRTLDIAAARPPTNPANCSALNASYAGCIADIKRPRLVPLDGNPPTVTKTSEHFDWLAVSGSTLLFVPDPYRARKHHGQLGSIHAGNTHRRFSTFQVGTLSEAYNKGVLTRNHFRRRLYVATNAHHVRKLLTVPRSVK
jgi:hypothetical protein